MAKDKANSFFANVVACVRYLCNVAKARFNAFQKAIDVPIDQEKNPPFVMIGGGTSGCGSHKHTALALAQSIAKIKHRTKGISIKRKEMGLV